MFVMQQGQEPSDRNGAQQAATAIDDGDVRIMTVNSGVNAGLTGLRFYFGRDVGVSPTTLYAAGDIASAAEALREFRAVDPDADTYLPESLRDWARTVE